MRRRSANPRGRLAGVGGAGCSGVPFARPGLTGARGAGSLPEAHFPRPLTHSLRFRFRPGLALRPGPSGASVLKPDPQDSTQVQSLKCPACIYLLVQWRLSELVGNAGQGSPRVGPEGTGVFRRRRHFPGREQLHLGSSRRKGQARAWPKSPPGRSAVPHP